MTKNTLCFQLLHWIGKEEKMSRSPPNALLHAMAAIYTHFYQDVHYYNLEQAFIFQTHTCTIYQGGWYTSAPVL